MSVGFLFNGFNNQFGAGVSCIINAVLLAGLLIHRPLSRELWRRAAPVIGLVTLATLWAGVIPALLPELFASMAFAPDLLMSGILGIAAGLIALLAGFALARDASRLASLLSALLAFGVVILLFGFYLRQGGSRGAWDLWSATTYTHRFAGTLSNANVAATYAGVLAVLALSKALAIVGRAGMFPRARADRVSLIMLVALVTAVLTAARAAMVICLGALLALLGRHRRSAGREASPAAFTIGIALFLCLTLAASQFALFEQRFGEIGAAIGLRWTMWRHYAGIAAASPLQGYGLGSFPAVNTYFLHDPALAQALWSVNSAHNIALQLMIEGGLPYLALLTAAALWIAAAIVRSMSVRRLSTEEAGLLAAVITVFGSASVDIALDVPAMVTLTLLLAGMLWGRDTVSPQIRISGAELPPAQKELLIGR